MQKRTYNTKYPYEFKPIYFVKIRNNNVVI